MIYLYDTFESYSDEEYLKNLNALPAWRRKKALQYKKLDDRKRSVLAFVLLQRALREEYGITELPEFVYNEFGKPSLSNLPIHFSLSHCKDAVACAVSDHNIGIDVESIAPYNPDVARRVCTATELEMLEQTNVKEIQEAVLILREMSADEKMKELARRRELALCDRITDLEVSRAEGRAEGLEEGMQKGLQKGKAEGIEETKKIFKLFMQGYNAERISQELRIPKEQVQSIID